MKIHKLEIENIASLKSSHQIDFDMLFKESSLFAITGKTGSGKSTILNCISLALFGRVYKKDSDGMDFVTLGESNGSISLTFSNLEQKYVAAWSLKLRKKNGELYKKPQLVRSLAVVGADAKLEYIETSIEEVIGLTFDQFCKTTILNQGQFAKFLTSNFKDRKDILEKFYQGIDLETLNVKLNEKIRLKKGVFEEAQNQIKGHTQAFEHIEVSPEQVIELESQAKDALKKKMILEKSNSIFKDIQGCFKTIEENTARLEQTNQKLEIDQNIFNSLKKQSDTISKQLIETERDLTNEKPILIEAIHKFNQKVTRTEKNDYLKLRDSSNKKQQQELLEELQIHSKKNERLLEQKKEILTAYPLMSKMPPKEIRELSDQYLNKLTEKKKNDETILFTKNQLADFKKEISEFERKVVDLDQVLKSRSESKINQELKTAKESYQKLVSYADFHTRSTSALNGLKKDIIELKSKEQEKANAFEEVELSIESLRNEISLSTKAFKFTELSLALHTCREESITKGECVVCNQTMPTVLDELSTENAQEIDSIKIRIERQERELSALKEKSSKLKLERLAITAKIEALKQESNQLKANKIIELQKVSSLGVNGQTTANQIATFIKEATQLELQLQDKKINHSKQLVQRENAKHELEKTGKRITDLNTRSNTLENSLITLTSELKALSCKLDIEQEETSFITEQKKAAEDYHLILEEIGLLKKDINNLDDNIEKVKIEAKSILSEIEENKKEIELINTFLLQNINSSFINDPSLRLSQLEERQLNQKNEALENSKELSQVEVKLAEHKSRRSNFTEQINGSKLLIESLKEKLRLNLLEISESDNSARLIKNLSELDPDEISIPELLAETHKYLLEALSTATEKAKETQRAFTERSNDLSRKIQNEKKVSELNKQTESIKNELDQLNNLYELIGKDEFRNYILSLIETTLIEQTNRELETLYQGRYSIVQTHKKNRAISEFKIVDYLKDGLSRKVSTLSGGETFLVSLAMALALAELTRGSTQIDSLFIDEGFGTLDQDSIDEVFELLEKIQHSGKQIGIISHVQSLTSRIGLNVNLEKNSDAASTINVVYN